MPLHAGLDRGGRRQAIGVLDATGTVLAGVEADHEAARAHARS